MLMAPDPALARRPAVRRGPSRALLLSAALHLAALIALIVVVPSAPPPPPPEESFAVEFEGPADSVQKGEHPAKVAAPADAPEPAHDNPAIATPKPAPIEAPAPPPPPPPPPQPVQSEAKPVPVPPPPTPPTPTLAPTRVPPPPPVKSVQPLKPPPPLDTVARQPNPTKNVAPDTHSLLATLEKFSADQKQVAPPKHVYNPERGGRPQGGGAAHGNLTGALSTGQRKQIGDEVRRCYSEDTAARNYATYSAMMVVTIDATGEARDAEIAPTDMARAAGDPAFRAFAERARRAVLDPECSRLPVPPDLLGKPSAQLTFRFRP